MEGALAGGTGREAALHGLALALLAPAWFCCGKLAQRARLPLITGFVIGGIICGPSALNVLPKEAQQTLRGVDHGCLAIIALTAGAELHFDNIKRIHKQVIAITLGVSACTWLCVCAVLTLLTPAIPFLRALPPGQGGAVASLAAMLAVARSPASAIAVVRETGGKGPFCSLVLAVVVMKDVLVFVCFAVNLEVARMVQVREREGGLHLARVVQPFLSLGASLAWGGLAGVAAHAFLGWRPGAWRPVAPVARRLPLSLLPRLKTLGLAGIAATVFWLADRAGAEPLLACVTAGIVTANRRGAGGEDVADHTARLMVAVNTTFFGLAGSSLRLGALLSTAWVAVMVWAARLAGIWAGSWAGGLAGGTPPEVRRRVWQGMVTQAGVAMGLAKTVATRFPTWGPEFATLMFAIILLNLFVGPPLFRSAIFAAGEARAGGGGGGILGDPEADARQSKHPPVLLAKDEAAASAAEKGLTKTPTSGQRGGVLGL